MPILTPGGNVSPCGELLIAALGLVAHTGGARRGVATARLSELGVPVDEAIQTASRYVGIPTDPDNRTWSVNYDTGGHAPLLTSRPPASYFRPPQRRPSWRDPGQPTPALAFQATLTAPRTYAFTTLAQAPLAWSFGDGTTSTELAPVHTYAPGTYTVSLTAMVRGAAQTVTSTLTVAPDAVVEKSSVGWWAAGAAALWLLSRFR